MPFLARYFSLDWTSDILNFTTKAHGINTQLYIMPESLTLCHTSGNLKITSRHFSGNLSISIIKYRIIK